MKKRLFSVLCILMGTIICNAQTRLHVSVQGNDNSKGDIYAPFATIGKAIDAARTIDDNNIEIVIHEGTYNLDHTEIINPERTGGKALAFKAYNDDKVTISSFKELELKWEKDKKGIWKAQCKDSISQLYIDGKRCILARYPNYSGDSAGVFGGTSSDALSKERIKKWKNPTGGIINTLHYYQWGSQHYRITGKIKDSITYEGGYQVSRPSKIHPSMRFVENIHEELDTINEWFWDRDTRYLYYKPANEQVISSSVFSTTTLPRLFSVEGTPEHPIRNISFENIHFTGADKTYLMPYDMLLRSDWAVYRGAALIFTNSEYCSVTGCEFEDLGGNALFIDNYAKGDIIKSNHIHNIGGTAIMIVGNTTAVRSGAYGYDNYVKYDDMDLTPGPANQLYPRECLVEDNLIHDLGFVEKQVAGVEVQTAAFITIRKNSIYDIPRSGINIGDDAFGGHIIEYNDIFNAVLETGDHGCFNSWGRDRFWHPSYKYMCSLVKEHPLLIGLDAVYTTIIRFNRMRCDHGWDIDLDDGSSNYHIYGNLCLNGGIKLREGFNRKVENNILVNNTLHPHVWFEDSHDIIRRNLFMKAYAPIRVIGFGEEIDYNFFSTEDGLEKSRKDMKGDAHSITGSFEFVDADNGDYTLKPGSDVFSIGFENIPVTGFGVYSESLRSIAKHPVHNSMQAIQYVGLGLHMKQ